MSSRQGTLYAHDGHARPGDRLVCADCEGTHAVTQGWIDKARRENPSVGGAIAQALQYIRPEAPAPFVPAHALSHIACPECSAVGGLSTLPPPKNSSAPQKEYTASSALGADKAECPKCDGTGGIDSSDCTFCAGSGWRG